MKPPIKVKPRQHSLPIGDVRFGTLCFLAARYGRRSQFGFRPTRRGHTMSRHNEMPPVPPANRSKKGTGDNTEVSKDMSQGHKEIVNTEEQGDTANIKQNTTNAGFYKGRRMK